MRAGTSAILTLNGEAVSITGAYYDYAAVAPAYFTGAYADVAYFTVPADRVMADVFIAVVTINKDGAIAETDRTNNTFTISIPIPVATVVAH